MVTKKPLWTLEQALIVVRFLQPLIRTAHYHLALGGGIINAGQSNKDIDLYFLPLENLPDNKEAEPQAKMKGLLDAIYGEGQPLIHAEYGEPGPNSVYQYKLTYTINDKRADVFIL